MEKEAALKKIDEIHSVLMGANRILFSGPQMITIGILLVLVPLIYHFTDGLSFGSEFLKTSKELSGLVNAVFFGLLFYLATTYGPGRDGSKLLSHPVLAKTFRFEKTLALLIFITGSTLALTDNRDLILPFILILLGFMFNVISSHAIPTIRFASWGLMVGGVSYIWIQYIVKSPALWMGGVIWMGIIYLWMGTSSLKGATERVEHGA